jgi:hypothetical protein
MSLDDLGMSGDRFIDLDVIGRIRGAIESDRRSEVPAGR